MNYGSVLQNWVQEISWMKQAVLLAAFRNCDTMDSKGPHKTLIRGIRMCCIRSSFPPDKLSSGFILPSPDEILEAAKVFINKEWDRFPIHFITHLMHAAEVLGYHHPDNKYGNAWWLVYNEIVKGLHLYPEPFTDFDARLSGDENYIAKCLEEENEQSN